MPNRSQGSLLAFPYSRMLFAFLLVGISSSCGKQSAGASAEGATPSASGPTGPIAVAVAGSATVGPEGATVQFEGGVVLEVSAGALAKPTVIKMTRTGSPSQFDTTPPTLAPVVSFEPSGLSFLKPARLLMALPSAAVAATPADSLVALAADEGDPNLEEIPVEMVGDAAALTIRHFTSYAVYGPTLQGALVGQFKACTTAFVRGIDKQILAAFQKLRPNALVPVDSPQIVWSGWGKPVLQGAVANDLLSALTTKPSIKLRINSAWRSVADQYVLSNCSNGNATASPGLSNHLDGTAVDLNPAMSKQQCNVLAGSNSQVDVASVHPEFGAAMQAKGFLWYGSDKLGASACGDPPHFDHVAENSSEMRSVGMQAFQNLWDQYNPADPIPSAERANAIAGRLSGSDLPDTLQKLARSPAAGFSSVARVAISIVEGSSPAVPVGGLVGLRAQAYDAAGAAVALQDIEFQWSSSSIDVLALSASGATAAGTGLKPGVSQVTVSAKGVSSPSVSISVGQTLLGSWVRYVGQCTYMGYNGGISMDGYNTCAPSPSESQLFNDVVLDLYTSTTGEVTVASTVPGSGLRTGTMPSEQMSTLDPTGLSVQGFVDFSKTLEDDPHQAAVAQQCEYWHYKYRFEYSAALGVDGKVTGGASFLFHDWVTLHEVHPDYVMWKPPVCNTCTNLPLWRDLTTSCSFGNPVLCGGEASCK
jgi:hypothetical protein